MPVSQLPSPINGVLLGCRQKYADGCPINLPIDGHNIGPWVKLKVKAGDSPLTVGNESCPGCSPAHTAVIKSFEYGTSDGFIVKCVIHDEAGGSFERVFEALNKDFCETTNNYTAEVEFGWTGTTCDGTPFLGPQSQTITFYMKSITTEMSQGKIVYEIEGTDLFSPMMSSRAYKIYPREIRLKEAIRQLFRDPPQPIVPDVKFLRRKPDGQIEEYEFKDHPDGPEGPWHPANRNKIGVALDWMKPYLTDRDKGCSDYTWNSGAATPGIIFWEDLADVPVKCSPLGAYIVNGGQYSPVISFQPKFAWNWTHANRAGGSAGGTRSSEPQDQNTETGGHRQSKDPCYKGVGAQTGGASGEHENDDQNFPQGAPGQRELQEGVAENILSRHPKANPITADLVIQGNPTITSTEAIRKSWIAIIVVNPFYLSGGQFGTDTQNPKCPDWTIRPPCNSLASNKKWMIMGVNHSIKDGSYVTTLKVRLDAPGFNLPSGANLGGQ